MGDDSDYSSDESGEHPSAGRQGGVAQDRPEVTGEAGGPKGLEPTRYGDWERNGRCVDF